MSQNLQNFAKFQNFQLENLVDFEKCCKTHIFLQKSELIKPKTGNILPKFCQPTRSAWLRGEVRRARGVAGRQADLSKIGKFCKFLAGSFSAVPKRNFGRKYAFDSIFKLYKMWTLSHRSKLNILQKFSPKVAEIFRK